MSRWRTVGILAVCLSFAGVAQQIVFQGYENGVLPTNGGDGTVPDPDGYPQEVEGPSTVTIDSANAAVGTKSISFSLQSGTTYAAWWSFNYGNFKPTGTALTQDGSVLTPRGFVRQYADSPSGWQFNTYNRFAFYMQCPTSATAHTTTGQHNIELGTYVKCITGAGCPDASSNETGGNHYYHFLNIPATGTWTRVIVNAHPDHQRGGAGDTEWGYQPYPTCNTSTRPDGTNLGGGSSSDCATYNYWDTFTSFYFEFDPYLTTLPPPYPKVYKYDGFEWYQETNSENDAKVLTMSLTYVASGNRVILCWRTRKDQTANFDVRYASSSIHAMGWASATPAPGGSGITFAGGAYNGLVYDNSTLSLAGMATLYVAVKDAASSLINQISIPLVAARSSSRQGRSTITGRSVH